MSSFSYSNMQQYDYEGCGKKKPACSQQQSCPQPPQQQCVKLPSTCGNVPPASNLPEVNRYTNTYEVKGAEQSGVVENYFDNYYNRYNHYNVDEVNYITDYVMDYNVYHIRSTQTVYSGCEYLGSEVIRVDSCGCPVPPPTPTPVPGPCPKPLPVCRPNCGC